MTPTKTDWISQAATAMSAIFIAMCLFSMADSYLGILRSKQSMQLIGLGLTSIAPDNLPGAADIFRTSIPVEDPAFPVNDLTRLRAWTELRGTLSAYAVRLELLNKQNRELDHHLGQRSLWMSFGSLGVGVVTMLFVSQNERRAKALARKGIARALYR